MSFIKLYKDHKGKFEFFIPLIGIIASITYSVMQEKTIWVSILTVFAVFTFISVILLMMEVLIQRDLL